MGTPVVSLVIPVHNGVDFVAESVAKCPGYEIVVVDDGSTDGMAAALGPLLDDRVRLISLPENLGKFAALKAGMTAATGKCRVFTDADLPYDLEAVPYIADLVNGRAWDIVVGDRALPESVSLSDSRVARKFSSRIFSYCVRMLVTGGLFDTQCGIKGFRDEVADGRMPSSPWSRTTASRATSSSSISRSNTIFRSAGSRFACNAPRRRPFGHNWNTGRYESETLSRIASQAYWQTARSDKPKDAP